MEKKLKMTTSAQLYEKHWKAVQKRHDLVATIRQNEDFFNGKQWPENDVYDDIRVTDNHIADLERKRSAKVTGTPMHLSYVDEMGKVDTTALSRYDNYVLAKLGYDVFRYQASLNGESVGTEIAYVRVDNDAPWLRGGFWNVGIEIEHIPLKNFYCANPYQPDIQKQEWVGFWTDIYVGALAKVIENEKFSEKEKNLRLERLYQEAMARESQPDDQNPDKDILNSTLLRVYCRYFRIDGEVCATLSTTYVDLYRFPRPLSTFVAEDFAKKVQEEWEKKAQEIKTDDGKRSFKLVDDLEIDFEDTIAEIGRKRVTEDDYSAHADKFYLYPFAVHTPKPINGFFFGRSITTEMISMQKGVNYGLSLELKALENLSFPKTYVREGAMKEGEFFSNRPEFNVQHDHYRGNGNGFYNLPTQSLPADVYKVSDHFVTEMKDSYDAKDFANGDMANPETSGYAVSLMLKQANAPLEQEQKRLWEFEVQLARIRLMFYRHYVDERKFTYELEPAEYEEEEASRKAILGGYASGGTINDPNTNQPIPFDRIIDRFGEKTKKTAIGTFDGRTLRGSDFDIKVTSQQGVVESELATSQWFSNMFGNGAIQGYQENPDLLEFVVKFAPPSVLPEEQRANMGRYVEQMKQSRIKQLEQQVQQLVQQNEEMAAMGKSQAEQFQQHMNMADTLVRNAQAERKQVMQQNQSLQQAGLEEGEIKSNNAKGQNAQTQLANAPLI